MSCHFANSHGTLLTLECSSLKIYTAWYNVCGYDQEPTLKVLHSHHSQILDKAVKACQGQTLYTLYLISPECTKGTLIRNIMIIAK